MIVCPGDRVLWLLHDEYACVCVCVHWMSGEIKTWIHAVQANYNLLLFLCLIWLFPPSFSLKRISRVLYLYFLSYHVYLMEFYLVFLSNCVCFMYFAYFCSHIASPSWVLPTFPLQCVLSMPHTHHMQLRCSILWNRDFQRFSFVKYATHDLNAFRTYENNSWNQTNKKIFMNNFIVSNPTWPQIYEWSIAFHVRSHKRYL